LAADNCQDFARDFWQHIRRDFWQFKNLTSGSAGNFWQCARNRIARNCVARFVWIASTALRVTKAL